MADKRIVVVGAGAIGGYTGGSLAHNGFDVTLIDPWPEHIEAIRKDGLSLEGISPEESVVAMRLRVTAVGVPVPSTALTVIGARAGTVTPFFPEMVVTFSRSTRYI